MAELDCTQLVLFGQHICSTRLFRATPNQGLTYTCTKCGKVKDAQDYYYRRDGYRLTECKACKRASSDARRQKGLADNAEAWHAKESADGKKRRRRIKEAVFQAYGGWICACCGETEPIFLTLDHMENNGAAERRAIAGTRNAAGYRTYAYLYAHDFPPGYQILCMNCQHGKLMNHGACPHQTRRNDYPEREYSQAAGSARHPDEG